MYALDLVIRQEGCRDYADILLSMKHVPNVIVYDYAQVLAKHCNARKKDLFQPHMGRVAEATEDNINAVQNDNFSVSFPWLNRKKVPSDGDNAHPITGSANRYCLLDKFHEKNPKKKEERLRRTGIVKELAGLLNTQGPEQINRKFGRDNYFLNMMSPANQFFILRLIMDLHNCRIYEGIRKNLQKRLGTQLAMDENGRLVRCNTG